MKGQLTLCETGVNTYIHSIPLPGMCCDEVEFHFVIQPFFNFMCQFYTSFNFVTLLSLYKTPY